MEKRIGLSVHYQEDTESGQNASFYAVMCKDENKAIKMTKWLASQGCNLHLIDKIGQSCLFYVARDGRLNLAKYLIDQAKVDINSVDTFGQTAFFYACREGHLEVCRLLADCGTDVDLQDTTAGETPLYYAIKNNHIKIVRFLIERAVNVNHCNAKQVSPYMLAKRENKVEIVKMLVSSGCITANVDDPLNMASTTCSRRRTSVLDVAAADAAKVLSYGAPSKR